MLELLGDGCTVAGAGPLALARVHGHRGGAAAARPDGRAAPVATSSGAAMRARCELGAAPAAVAARGAGGGVGGGAPRTGVDVVSGAGVRPVGARQHRA